MISVDQLQAATECTPLRARHWQPFFDGVLDGFGINTSAQLAMFFAQVGHETAGLQFVVEIWGPTEQQRRYEPPSSLAARLGNTQPGDGRRYLGRGPFQYTGRANACRARDGLRAMLPDSDVPDFEASPQLLELPLWGALSACLYWRDRDLGPLAEAGDLEAVTRRINGGLNGIDDRRRRWLAAKRAFGLA